MAKLNKKGFGAVEVVLLVVVLAVAGFVLWSTVLNKDDTDSGDTSTTTQQTQTSEAEEPKTEITASGQQTKLTISPSVDRTISGIVTIALPETPDGTNMAFFVLTEQGSESLEGEGPNLGGDDDASDGWSVIFDTSKYDNGVYDITGLPTASANSNPFEAVTAQVIIEN